MKRLIVSILIFIPLFIAVVCCAFFIAHLTALKQINHAIYVLFGFAPLIIFLMVEFFDWAIFKTKA